MLILSQNINGMSFLKSDKLFVISILSYNINDMSFSRWDQLSKKINKRKRKHLYTYSLSAVYDVAPRCAVNSLPIPCSTTISMPHKIVSPQHIFLFITVVVVPLAATIIFWKYMYKLKLISHFKVTQQTQNALYTLLKFYFKMSSSSSIRPIRWCCQKRGLSGTLCAQHLLNCKKMKAKVCVQKQEILLYREIVRSSTNQLVNDYILDDAVYAEKFRRRFRMSKVLFLRMVDDIQNRFPYFWQRACNILFWIVCDLGFVGCNPGMRKP